jgi:hypothetical protein
MMQDSMLLPPESPVRLPGAIQFDLHSAHTGRTHRIFVYEPASPPPPAGWPVVVLTDGNLTFPLAATMDGAFALRGGAAALIVGVGYPTDDPAELIGLRTRDLTPTAPAAGPDDCGGAEAFYRFLTRELRPVIAASFAVDPADQTLFGHAWGGLFVLNVLFRHPHAYRVYAASSPAIWWDGKAVLAAEGCFSRAVEAGLVAPRVFVTVGSEEQSPLRGLGCVARQQMARMLADARMVDNACDLVDRLQALKGAAGYAVAGQVFDGDDQVTALPAAIARALAFALRG